MRKAQQVRVPFWLTVSVVVAAASVQPLPAHAQFFGFRWGGPSYQAPSPPSRGGYFSFPFFGRPSSPYGAPGYAPPPESYRAPPPRKAETQPATTVAVIGDSMADWLSYGLEEIYADNPQIGIVRHVRVSSGLVHYEPRNETLDWSQAVKDILATEKPAAIVVMLGLNDRVSLRSPIPAAHESGQHPDKPQGAKPAPDSPQADNGKAAQQPAEAADNANPEQPNKPQAAPAGQRPGASYEFRSDEWAKLYAKRIDAMIAALKGKGVPVLWVGLPAIRGPRATGDMSYLDDLYQAAADKAGIVYVDIWDGFVDENGRYAVEGPDFEGQIRRLRTGDGVHFTKYGALKLAHLVDQELSRVLANPVTPAAPAPQASIPAKPGAARPAVGPVLPLTTAGGSSSDALLAGIDHSTLLGEGSKPPPARSEDASARNVLVRGDPLAAPAGRADDFAWPPGGNAASPPATAGAH